MTSTNPIAKGDLHRGRAEAEPAGKRPSVLPSLVRNLTPLSLALYLFSGIAFTTIMVRAGFSSLLDVGYGDSYVLYDVLNFEKTGIIYRELSGPPYLPPQYSPLVYITYSLSRYFPSSNIFLGPRLIAFVWFLLCLTIVILITQKLIPVRFSWFWGLMVAASIHSLGLWILCLRGDFMGIFFGLSAIRLLLSRSRYAPIAAGLCAGLAIQVKLTLLAASCAGFMWLLMRRRWKDSVAFAIGVTLTSFGLFFLYWLREPNMLPEMTVFMPGIKEIPGLSRLIILALAEVVVLLSIPAFFLILPRIWPLRKQWPHWALLALYVLISAALACLAGLQAGGNSNYFFEPLFALTPFAVIGIFRLFCWSRYGGWAPAFLAAIFLIYLPVSDLRTKHNKSDYSIGVVREMNSQFKVLETALRGHPVLSLEPRIALIDPQPALLDPYLLSYLRRLHRFDATPLVTRISAGYFDLFVQIKPTDRVFRGISKFEGLDLQSAVAKAYRPYCQLWGDIFELPLSRPVGETFKNQLRAAGCEALDADMAGYSPR